MFILVQTNALMCILGGFDEQVDREVLYRAFLPFGEIVDVELPTDPKLG
jgi:hypothetical protein